MALSEQEELELIDIELAMREKEQAASVDPMSSAVKGGMAALGGGMDDLASFAPQMMASGEKAAQAGKLSTPGGLADEGFNRGGEAIAEGLAPMVGPNLAALAGTTFAMIPDAVSAFGGGVKPGAKGLRKVGEVVKEETKPVRRFVGDVVDAVKDTGAKEVSKLNVKKAELPLEQLAKREAAELSLKASGKEIQKAEEALGIGQKTRDTQSIASIIKSPEKLSKFADRASKLADKGADWLAERSTPEALQFYRKAAQDGAKAAGKTLPTEARNKLFQVNKVFTEAIGKTKEGSGAGFDKAVNTYNEMDKLVRAMPKEFTKEKKMLEAALARAKALKERQAPLRKAAGIAGRSIAYGAGAVAAATGVKKILGQ